MRQAVGRVHRIGQTKETSVWHFIAKDTVEEGLHAGLRARAAQHAAAATAAASGASAEPVLADAGPGLSAKSLLARPHDFYSKQRLAGQRFWLDATCKRHTGCALPADVSDDVLALAK